MKKNPSIGELEAALADGEPIEIRPDGSIKRARRRRRRAEKPLTMGRNLGGEYASTIPATSLETAYGKATRLAFQIMVF